MTETVIVKLASAIICFAGQCAPVLTGADTPVGTFQLQERRVLAEGYGGSVLQFKEDDRYVWAIHAVWTGNPAEMRMQRLRSATPSDNMVTLGCLNVLPETYYAIKACCANATLVIEE